MAFLDLVINEQNAFADFSVIKHLLKLQLYHVVY